MGIYTDIPPRHYASGLCGVMEESIEMCVLLLLLLFLIMTNRSFQLPRIAFHVIFDLQFETIILFPY